MGQGFKHRGDNDELSKTGGREFKSSRPDQKNIDQERPSGRSFSSLYIRSRAGLCCKFGTSGASLLVETMTPPTMASTPPTAWMKVMESCRMSRAKMAAKRGTVCEMADISQA